MPVFFLGALIGLIGSVFVNIGAIVLKVVNVIMPVMDKVFDALKTVINRIGSSAGSFFRFIAGAARKIYDGLIKFWNEILPSWFERFGKWLKETFKPITEFFNTIQGWLDIAWDRVIGPVLDAIDKIRAGLRILAKLGVPFVDELDKILQSIQREIFEGFRTVQNWVNTATFWLDILLDPRGWIRFTPFLTTVYYAAGNIFNIITGLADIGGKSEKENEAFRDRNRPRSIERTVERVRTGELQQSAAVQNAAARFRTGQSGTIFQA